MHETRFEFRSHGTEAVEKLPTMVAGENLDGSESCSRLGGSDRIGIDIESRFFPQILHKTHRTDDITTIDSQRFAQGCNKNIDWPRAGEFLCTSAGRTKRSYAVRVVHHDDDVLIEL